MLVTRMTAWNLLFVTAIGTMDLGGASIAQESPGATPAKEWKIVAQAEHRIYTGLNVNPEANGKTCRVFRTQEELHARVQPGQKGREVEARICGLLKIDRIDWNQHMLLLLQPGFSSDYVTINIVSLTSDANGLTVAYEYFQRPRGQAGNGPQALVLVPKTSVDAKPAAMFVQLREGRKVKADASSTTVSQPSKSGVTLTLSVELRGKLTFTEKQVTVLVSESKPGDPAATVEAIWTLDLSSEKGLLKNAKQLDGKEVVVVGACRLLGVKTETRKYKSGALSQPYDKLPWQVASGSVLDLERTVRVQSLKGTGKLEEVNAVPDQANPEAAKPVSNAETKKEQPAPGGNQIPDNVRTNLEKADQIELFSIDPNVGRDKSKDTFHGSHVLGKTVIKDAETRTKLMKALTKGVKDKQTEVRSAAFYPRHAIRATHGKTTVDLLIGFDDSAIIVYNGNTFQGFVFTTASPQPVFDQVLRDAKVPLAKPNKK